ncbi:hypothetical protein LB531_21265 [Mesorhizobium sp. CO1-1-2]|uniref:hypothetical protein n=1 Tax=Mesorhizobium sp. CO1-1-2 TaxID=2876635 RepID=UPI001CCB6E9A|nr:hypothetical protein [Mesorhizobium sp. CO1-1-2]MBZ9683191.1 hypothetical protein [Mesorhizobium sp. CO1-1-2]
MPKLIAAYTTMEPLYPAFVNISRDDDGSVVIYVRANPETHADRVHICGYAADKGKPGRCTPGDERCNNYCNMAPDKGPMADRPTPSSQTFVGNTAAARLTGDEWEKLLGALTGQ